MAAKKTLKDQNKATLRTFLALYVIGWSWLLYKYTDLFRFKHELEEFISTEWGMLLPLAGAGVIIGIAVDILSHIFNPHQKAILVFWRYHNPLPGCRAFTHSIKDHRIDASKLEHVYSPFPNVPRDQNALFYKWYKRHEAMPQIVDAQKMYLRFRDLTAISFISLWFFGLTLFWFLGPIKAVWGYLSLMFLVHLLLTVAAKNTGEQLVRNVLAAESSRL